jgi:7-cyano-7-deazaguanine synthase
VLVMSGQSGYQVGSRIQFERDRNAIVMTSGGADSVPVLYYVTKIIRPKHVLAIHADYGQRMMEMERLGVTRNVDNLKRQGFNVDLKTVDIRWLGQLSTSKLVRSEDLPETPQDSLQNPDAAAERILWWWDVVRNLQLTTIGLAHAESLDLRSYLTSKKRLIYDVYLGIRRETPVAMKDNTEEFVEEMNRVSEISTHFGGYQVLAPFIGLDKGAIIRMGDILGVPWESTFSCYSNTDQWINHPISGEKVLVHCGTCSSCRRRAKGFVDAKVYDPSIYSEHPLEGSEYATIPDSTPKAWMMVPKK